MAEYRDKSCRAWLLQRLYDTVSIICGEDGNCAKDRQDVGPGGHMGDDGYKQTYLREMEYEARDILARMSAGGASDVRAWDDGLKALASWSGRMRQTAKDAQDTREKPDMQRMRATEKDGANSLIGSRKNDSAKDAKDGRDPDGWLDKLDAMLGEFAHELYSYYPLLRLPGSAGYIGFRCRSCGGDVRSGVSAELLARYRKAEAVLKPGAAKEGSTETEACVRRCWNCWHRASGI